MDSSAQAIYARLRSHYEAAFNSSVAARKAGGETGVVNGQREAIRVSAMATAAAIAAAAKELAAIHERFKNIEASHATLEMECRDMPRFCGAYQRGTRYERGAWVVFGGSTWACVKDTTDEPGAQTDAWMVAARRGQGAR